MRLISIAIRAASQAPMHTLEQAMVTRVAGVAGDVRGKPGNRQITLLSATQWQDVCYDLGSELPWTLRRANLFIEGIEFGPSTQGMQLQVGNLLLHITGETAPCSRMDAQFPGLTRALTPCWRGGVTGRVVADATIQINDDVSWH